MAASLQASSDSAQHIPTIKDSSLESFSQWDSQQRLMSALRELQAFANGKGDRLRFQNLITRMPVAEIESVVEDALSVARDNPKCINYAMVAALLDLGEVAAERKANYNSAQLYAEAYNFANQLPANVFRGRAIIDLAMMHFGDKKTPETGVKLVGEAAKTLRNHETGKVLLLPALESVAVYHAAANRPKQAAETYAEIEAIIKELPAHSSHPFVIGSLQMLGYNAKHAKELDRAEKIALDVLGRVRSGGGSGSVAEAQALSLLGDVYHELRQPKQARECLQRAVGIIEALGEEVEPEDIDLLSYTRQSLIEVIKRTRGLEPLIAEQEAKLESSHLKKQG